MREWSNDPLTANDFYDRAIIVRLRWVNGLLLPEYAWSLLEAAAITDLGATIYNHARRNYANNRLRSPRAAMGRQVLLRCSFRDGGIDVIEMAARALEAYCPEEEAAVWIARLRELAGENQ